MTQKRGRPDRSPTPAPRAWAPRFSGAKPCATAAALLSQTKKRQTRSHKASVAFPKLVKTKQKLLEAGRKVLDEARTPPPRGPSWRRRAKERRAPFCLSAHRAPDPLLPTPHSSLPAYRTPRFGFPQKSPLTAMTERPSCRSPHRPPHSDAITSTAARTNRSNAPHPPSTRQVPGCNSGRGQAEERGTAVHAGREEEPGCVLATRVHSRVWRKFGPSRDP